MGRLITKESVIDVLKQTGIIQDNDLGHLVVDEINRIATAYDVDKVVAELEEKIKAVEKIIVTPPQNKLDEITNDTAKDFVGAWKSAIKVVRKGGGE